MSQLAAIPAKFFTATATLPIAEGDCCDRVWLCRSRQRPRQSSLLLLRRYQLQREIVVIGSGCIAVGSNPGHTFTATAALPIAEGACCAIWLVCQLVFEENSPFHNFAIFPRRTIERGQVSPYLGKVLALCDSFRLASFKLDLKN